MRKRNWMALLLVLCMAVTGFPFTASKHVQAATSDYLLSLNRPAYASSSNGNNTPDLAVDGALNTRWESAWQKDPQWIYVDLGASASISRVTINWENAYSTAFQIQVSDDEVNWTSVYSTTSGTGGLTDLPLAATGRFVRLYSTARAQAAYGVSLYEFSVYGTGGVNPPPAPVTPNIALNQPVTASSTENQEPGKAGLAPQNYLATNATDGDPNTRWSSKYGDNEWVYVDLGQSYEIGSVVLNWEASYGRAYDIQVSADAQNWTTVYRQLKGSGGKETIPLYANGRYVRMSGIARGTGFGYSLYEFEVHPYVAGTPQPVYVIPTIPTASAVPVGAGSYEINDITQLEPLNPKYRTANVTSPIPSNGWWQSLLISNLGNGNGIVTLPLKSKYTKQGLAILNPGAGYTSADGGSMNADGHPDLYVTSSAINPATMQTKISGYGTYSASAILSDDDTAKMSTTFVKGSPYVYNTFAQPDSVVMQAPGLTRLFDDNNQPILQNDGVAWTGDHIGIEVVGTDNAPTPQTFTRDYGVFAPPGTVFMKIGNAIKIKLGNGDHYLSVASLTSAADLSYFYQHAYAFVVDTQVSYSYDQASAMVTTHFNSTTTLKRPGFSSDTLMALLPHQWKVSSTPLTALTYPSIRGTLKVHEGDMFTTADRFYGIVPQFVEPKDSTYSRAQLSAYLDSLDADLANGLMINDPYWQGKKLHPLALATIISDQMGDYARRDRYVGMLKSILTDWYTYSPDDPLHSYYFHYSPDWGTVFPYHSGFGLNTGLSDHHFTYGYFVFASAVLATYDKSFMNDYGGMVELLIRDYANPAKTDSQFPSFRNFDPYEGHSWAGGYADNPSGNNQEAAGEALFGWVGEYMWGMVTGNNTYRDAGIWGFTTEEKAVEQYWFNYDHDNWLPSYQHATVGQVYGSGYLFGTYFSGDPQMIYGIHWLPPAEWMSYYGRVPAKAAALYAGMVKDHGGPENTWLHIIWPFESLSDPQAVLAKWDTTNMQQNEAFNAYWIVHSMATLGSRSMDLWANDPGVTVYKNGTQYTAQVWNPTASAKSVAFQNASGVVGSATVPANSLVSVDPTKVTTVPPRAAGAGVQVLNRTGWTVTASSANADTPKMLDGDLSTRWTSQQPQQSGQWIQVDMGSQQSFDTIFMNSGTSWGDYAHGYQVFVSNDGTNWGNPIASGTGSSQSIPVSFPVQQARYIKIVQTGTASNWWSIAELNVVNFSASSSATGPLDRSKWTVSASSTGGADVAANVLDGSESTRWSSGQEQTNGQWFQVDLGVSQTFDTVVMDSGLYTSDYARGYRLFVSNDGTNWGEAVAGGTGNSPRITATFQPQTARYLKIVQTGRASNWWSIAELTVANNGAGKQKALSRAGWQMTVSSALYGQGAANMLDGSIDTSWTSGAPQTNGQWITLDMGGVQSFDQLVMDSGSNTSDYAHQYQVFVSNDGSTWGAPIASGTGTAAVLTTTFPMQTARYVKVVQTGTDSHWWSIAELNVLAADPNGAEGDISPAPLDRTSWTLTASSSTATNTTLNMVDGDLSTPWSSGVQQTNGQWIQVDLGSAQSFEQIVMESFGANANDYARGYQILVSNDAASWTAVALGIGTSGVVAPTFPMQTARYIKIVQTGTASYWWSINELNVYK